MRKPRLGKGYAPQPRQPQPLWDASQQQPPPKESYLHQAWASLSWHGQPLFTSTGLALHVLHPGQYNRQDAGPDFQLATLLIDGRHWVGHVEIHIRASDWMRHHHQYDPAYAATILHVVWIDDLPKPPVAPLHYPPFLLSLQHLPLLSPCATAMPAATTHLPPLACHATATRVPAELWQGWLQQQAQQRMAQKASVWQTQLLQHNHDWQALAWAALAMGFGMLKNKEPFVDLAQRLPFKAMRKLSNEPNKLITLALGMAGLLAKAHPDQPEAAQQFLAYKHFLGLSAAPMQPSNWLYARMRPPAFPHKRIAQWVALGCHHQDLAGLLLSNSSLPAWQKCFTEVAAATGITMPGKDLQLHLLINVSLPLQYLYHAGNTLKQAAVLQALESLASEDTQVTRLFAGTGVPSPHAATSQGMHQLHKHMCSTGGCGSCAVFKYLRQG